MNGPFTWTSSLFREMELIDECHLVSPDKPPLEGEMPLLVLEDVALRKMFNILMLYDARFMCAHMFAHAWDVPDVHIENPFGDYRRIVQVRNFIHQFFQISCKEMYPKLWEIEELTVRKGWIIVKTSRFAQMMEVLDGHFNLQEGG